jgi:hypothetical protein
MSAAPEPTKTDGITPRLGNEGGKAYAAFCTYRDLGPGRTLLKVRKQFGNSTLHPERSLRLLQRWSAKFDWVSRCRAFDSHMMAIEDRVREKAAARHARLWAERQNAFMENAFLAADRLREVAKEILDLPVTRTISGEDGRPVVVANGKLSLKDAALYLKTSAEVACSIFAALEKDVDTMSPEELRALATSRYPEEPEDDHA